MSAETVLDTQAQLEALSDQLFQASAVDPSKHQAEVNAVIAKAGEIYSTPGMHEELAVQAAYLILNGLRISRQYLFNPDRNRVETLTAQERPYRERIDKYDQSRKEAVRLAVR